MALVELLAVSSRHSFTEAAVVALADCPPEEMEMSRRASANGIGAGRHAAQHPPRQSAGRQVVGQPDRGATEPDIHTRPARTSPKAPVPGQYEAIEGNGILPKPPNRVLAPGMWELMNSMPARTGSSTATGRFFLMLMVSRRVWHELSLSCSSSYSRQPGKYEAQKPHAALSGV